MQKTYFHNYKSISENNDQKKTIPTNYIKQRKIVDINKLLNRVKMNKKYEAKKKIIFCTSVLLALGFFLTLIAIIK
ncbi:hypothetical protein OAB10_05350 [Candidatus Pelagibacter sp.]|nr:hypothetical protein [Candidatus Pelagibacter sp.]